MGFWINQIRKIWWTMFYYAFGRLLFFNLGKGCRFEGWIDIPQRGGKITLGDHVYICRRVILTVTKDATLSLGNNAFIGPGVVISAHREIEIGSNCLIAEYVSIYDNDHAATYISKPISDQGYVAEPCKIEDGCWIGSGAKILRGAGLGKNCILGAGAVLKKVLPKHVIAAGVPARVVKQRAHAPSSDNQVASVV